MFRSLAPLGSPRGQEAAAPVNHQHKCRPPPPYPQVSETPHFPRLQRCASNDMHTRRKVSCSSHHAPSAPTIHPQQLHPPSAARPGPCCRRRRRRTWPKCSWCSSVMASTANTTSARSWRGGGQEHMCGGGCGVSFIGNSVDAVEAWRLAWLAASVKISTVVLYASPCWAAYPAPTHAMQRKPAALLIFPLFYTHSTYGTPPIAPIPQYRLQLTPLPVLRSFSLVLV